MGLTFVTNFRRRQREPMLLIMGLGAQMVLWDDAFCERLPRAGSASSGSTTGDIGQILETLGGKRLTPMELLKLRS